MKFCSQCGGPLTVRIPAGDSLPRHVCDLCHTIHYQNPRLIVGCIPRWQGKILLCRRAIEPRRGYWTIPAGFMENGETTQQAAARETLEEALARVRVGPLYSLFNLPGHNQVYLIFLGEMESDEYGAGEESLESALFDEARLPWGELAFHAVEFSLRNYFADQDRGRFAFRIGDLQPNADNPLLTSHETGCIFGQETFGPT